MKELLDNLLENGKDIFKPREEETLPVFMNDVIATKLLVRVFGVPQDAAEEMVKLSREPEVKSKIGAKAIEILACVTDLDYREAAEFVARYSDATPFEMIGAILNLPVSKKLDAPTTKELPAAEEKAEDIFKPRDRKEYEEELEPKLDSIHGAELQKFMEEDFWNLDESILLKIIAEYIEVPPSIVLANLIFEELSEKNLKEVYMKYIIRKEQE